MSYEIPLFKTIIKYRELFTLFIQPQLLLSIAIQNLIEIHKNQEIGVGANAKVFVNFYKDEYFALKSMEKVNLNMLESYIQECINQYNLLKVNKEYILNFSGLVYISIINSQASIYIPLELAEYSLFEYIQNQEITQEIYQYFYNLLIEMLVLLHSNNYAHRDIKPQNILFIKGQGWKLADFGESIKYEQRQDLYKIQGTVSFLPSEIRKQMNNKHKQIYQDLFKNDLYAVICTLVMIKNPQFKPKDLINYMNNQEFDQAQQQLFSILKYEQSFNQLLSIKPLNQQMNIELFQTDIKVFSSIELNFETTLLIYYRLGYAIDYDSIILIDDQLKMLKQDNKLDQYLKFQFYLMLLFPLQVHQLNNFNSQLLTYKEIINNSRLYLENQIINYIFIDTFIQEYMFIKYIIGQAIESQNKFMIIYFIDTFIRLGNFKLVQNLLQIMGKILLNDINFDSNLFLLYNMFYYQIQKQYNYLIYGKAVSFDENYIKSNCLKVKEYNKVLNIQNQFNLQQYLNEDKFINKDQVNLIILLYPLFPQYKQDIQTLNVVYKHILETLKLSEYEIIDDRFSLSNNLKQQLIIGGYKLYKTYMNEIIEGIVKLFLNYDIFEGLLDLLNYFLYFMNFMDKLAYYSIVSIIQYFIFYLNISIYHIKDDLDVQFLNIKQKQIKSYYLRKIHFHLLIQQNKLLFNIIQDQQRTQQQKIESDNQEQIIFMLKKAKVKQTFILFYDQKIYLSIKKYGLFLSYIQSQNQKYLSLLVLIFKYLCGDSIDQQQIIFKINREEIKFKFDPILLQYYILCKQNNRINELFNDWKRYDNLKPQKNIIFKPLSEIVLMRQNSMNRFNPKYDFIYLQSLSRFVVNQKFRSFFNFKQHLQAASISKSIQKRLKVPNIILKEQFLGII